MALREGDAKNFVTLKKAFANGDVALVECKDNATGEYRAVICIVMGKEGGMVQLAPLAEMAKGDPFDQWTPLIEDPKSPLSR
jgi:hypothetical protein